MKNIPLLTPADIECRVQQLSEKTDAVSILLYKDARTDMRILDEVYGSGNWQRTHEVINGNLFCNIDIWDEDKKCWVRKQDVGVESNTEKEKGQASDSFKRAGFNVGIGRELYTAPSIWINCVPDEITINPKTGKKALKSKVKFRVSHINYNERREITELVIVDTNGEVRYSMGKKEKAARVGDLPTTKGNEPAFDTPVQTAIIACAECGTEISPRVHDYAVKAFGRPLCMVCQKKVGK